MLFSGELTEPSEEVMEDFSKNREMRQARVDVLFKDYEVRHKCDSFKVNESKGEKNLCNPPFTICTVSYSISGSSLVLQLLLSRMQ